MEEGKATNNECSNSGVLFYCRTPLQALIVEKIIECITEPITLIYHPHSLQQKHKIYFDRIPVERKFYIPWQPNKWSNVLSYFLAYRRFPPEVLKQQFSSVYFASIGDFALALVIKKNPKAKLISYDDGVFNISKDTYENWILNETFSLKILKAIFNAPNNKVINNKISHHYTIFEKKFIVGLKCEIKKINFLSRNKKRTKEFKKGVRILFGTAFSSGNVLDWAQYNSIKSFYDFDLFIPHPSTTEMPLASNKILRIISINDLSNMVAEDIVIKLAYSCERLIVYGFSSTALVTTANFARAVNINLSGRSGVFSSELLNAMHIKSISLKNQHCKNEHTTEF
jgi:hypothetical protein